MDPLSPPKLPSPPFIHFLSEKLAEKYTHREIYKMWKELPKEKKIVTTLLSYGSDLSFFPSFLFFVSSGSYLSFSPLGLSCKESGRTK